MENLYVFFLHGLAYAGLLFLVSSGLTLVFGMMNILNFAHAAMYMLGAYFSYSLLLSSSGNLWLSLLLCPITLFVIGAFSAISLEMSTTILLMTFVGGTRVFWGPILGALVYIVLQNYLSAITERWPLFMGFLFVFMVLFVPGGLSGLIVDVRERIRKGGKNGYNMVSVLERG